MADLVAHTIAVTREVAMEAYALPGTFHRDPADQILVATARQDGLTLVTADDRILAYPDDATARGTLALSRNLHRKLEIIRLRRPRTNTYHAT